MTSCAEANLVGPAELAILATGDRDLKTRNRTTWESARPYDARHVSLSCGDHISLAESKLRVFREACMMHTTMGMTMPEEMRECLPRGEREGAGAR